MRIKKRYFFLSIFLAIFISACNLFATETINNNSITLTVSAASDLNYVFEEMGTLWEEETGNKVLFNFGSTGKLAQQIERGAPVDLFAGANKSYIEDLDRLGLIVSETKALYGQGRITLWTRDDSTLNPRDIRELTRSEYGRVAIANPDHAPYGIAAREALESVGIWQEIQPKLILGENISQTKQYAETGNVDVAIMALSLSLNHLGKWELIPNNLHQPIDQMLAVMEKSNHQTEARHFAEYINGIKGRELMKKYGFVLPQEMID